MAATEPITVPVRAILDTSELADEIEKLIALVKSAREVIRSAREVTSATEEVTELTGELLSVGPTFLHLTVMATGDAVSINTDRIDAFMPGRDGGTVIHTSCTQWIVREPFSDVFALVTGNNE